MPSRTMLIDASHPEETRVVVVDGSRVEDYDVEVASRRQLKGNIYLAKVTRVEPSLQAAFVDYGGNRHGFLAFNEIHPDYYQIPVADRERLLAEQAAESTERDESDEPVGEAFGDDEEEVERRRSRPPTRFYKIQEVIKRRQIMLVQVTKEERGNKGAALTSYLSLAGRYCVLMPNTARGGGISRKIAVATDRKRLKKMMSELEVPDGMAVIVRTAGAGRSKTEIKRDYEYLMRLWSSIRETTLGSTAPTLVYEEASLIKRSIRDLYDRDIEEIVVQGDEEYRISKDFMKLFISSHAKRVKPYEDGEVPLFHKYGIEDQLALMHQPTVQLRSGGYIVINPTEALVAIDVNSGRSTRERNIEETALRTNLEAADEIARQLRLRDLAGLIVIDFIDMENARNQGQVERRVKEAMKTDRARVQLGRISPFGLLELSRQRLRPSLIETSFEVCCACGGNGLRRTTESTALAILRKLEEEGIRRRASEAAITVPPAVASYLLNQKRRSLQTVEDRYGMAVTVLEDATLVPPDFRLSRLKPYDAQPAEEPVESEEASPEIEVVDSSEAVAERDEGAANRGRRRRPRRRRRDDDETLQASGGQAADMEEPEDSAADTADADGDGEAEAEAEADGANGDAEVLAEEGADLPNRKKRRRGKRGGRRRGRPDGSATLLATDVEAEENERSTADAYASEVMDDEGSPIWAVGEARRERSAAAADGLEEGAGAAASDTGEAGEGSRDTAGSGDEVKRRRRSPRRSRAKQSAPPAASDQEAAAETEGAAADSADDGADTAAEVTETGAAVVDVFATEESAAEESAAEESAAEESAAEESATEESATEESAAEEGAAEESAAEESATEEGAMAGAEPLLEDDDGYRPWRANGEGDASELFAVASEFSPAAGAGSLSSDADADADADRAHREEEERRAEEARRTEVIRVGEGGDPREEMPRRGWWQRLLT